MPSSGNQPKTLVSVFTRVFSSCYFSDKHPLSQYSQVVRTKDLSQLQNGTLICGGTLPRRIPACLPQPTHPEPTQYQPSQPQPNHHQPRPPQSNSVLSKPEAIHRPLHCERPLHSALNYKAKSNYTRSCSLLGPLQNYNQTAPYKLGTGPGPTTGTASVKELTSAQHLCFQDYLKNEILTTYQRAAELSYEIPAPSHQRNPATEQRLYRQWTVTGHLTRRHCPSDACSRDTPWHRGIPFSGESPEKTPWDAKKPWSPS
ncbi:hypothetical protein HNY73_001173 [Argiope bruennichi]|uniref:Uncharacterized protein n=1 Tax=Argiope bruennichi TaxID=94029 RepID=A0A8T0G4Q8_ARGBR|nr:hypothetical protein HNY73_001173 [Argiope bruennichi]